MNTKIQLQHPFNGIGEFNEDYNTINITPEREYPFIIPYKRYLLSIERGRIISLVEFDRYLELHPGPLTPMQTVVKITSTKKELSMFKIIENAASSFNKFIASLFTISYYSSWFKKHDEIDISELATQIKETNKFLEEQNKEKIAEDIDNAIMLLCSKGYVVIHVDAEAFTKEFDLMNTPLIKAGFDEKLVLLLLGSKYKIYFVGDLVQLSFNDLVSFIDDSSPCKLHGFGLASFIKLVNQVYKLNLKFDTKLINWERPNVYTLELKPVNVTKHN